MLLLPCSAFGSGIFNPGSGSGGSGGGASTLGVYNGFSNNPGVVVSTPTAAINADVANFKVSLQGGATAFIQLRANEKSITADYVATSTDTIILADATSAAVTITLPTAVGISGKVYTVKRTNAGANTVTVATTSSQTIDGATTQVLTVQYTSIDIISDNSNWSIL